MDRLDENKWATLRVLDYSDAQHTEDYNKAGEKTTIDCKSCKHDKLYFGLFSLKNMQNCKNGWTSTTCDANKYYFTLVILNSGPQKSLKSHGSYLQIMLVLFSGPTSFFYIQRWFLEDVWNEFSLKYTQVAYLNLNCCFNLTHFTNRSVSFYGRGAYFIFL